MQIPTTFRTLFCTLALTVSCFLPVEGGNVAVAIKPEGPWRLFPTRTLEDLPPEATSQLDGALNEYGGLRAQTVKAKGFFYTTNIDGRWWLVDPIGGLFMNKGVAAVSMLGSSTARAVLKEKFGNDSDWASRSTAMLRDHGFNGVGAWSDIERLRVVGQPLPYTRIWNFMSAYGKRRGGIYQQAGHTGYPNDAIFVFDPEFEIFCDEYAKGLAASKDDPWLIGHFSDNELPFSREALANFLSLPAGDPGQQAAQDWLRARHGEQATVRDITTQDKQEFLAVVVDRYFSIVSRAMRKFDPNHLLIGARFLGTSARLPEVLKAAGPYLDVISVNLYHSWTPNPDLLAMWTNMSGRPFLITEWYAKAMDTGMPNHSGAGWVVRTQANRARFYENFTLGLLESKACVGWHWFKYSDNDPTDANADPSNIDSNKGVVSNRYVPYQTLMDSMKRINERVYGLTRFFDSTHSMSSP